MVGCVHRLGGWRLPPQAKNAPRGGAHHVMYIACVSNMGRHQSGIQFPEENSRPSSWAKVLAGFKFKSLLAAATGVQTDLPPGLAAVRFLEKLGSAGNSRHTTFRGVARSLGWSRLSHQERTRQVAGSFNPDSEMGFKGSQPSRHRARVWQKDQGIGSTLPADPQAAGHRPALRKGVLRRAFRPQFGLRRLGSV